MDTRSVIARFEAERQALAMMDNASIARVLDAGTTASGRPFFVMELVHGVEITKYCEQNQPGGTPLRSTADRVKLRWKLFGIVAHTEPLRRVVPEQ
jgi:serine/threonine protein kinase